MRPDYDIEAAGAAVETGGAAKKPKAGLGQFFGLVASTKPPLWMLGLAAVGNLANTAGALILPQFTKGLIDGFSLSSLKPVQIAFIGAAFIVQMAGSALSIWLLGMIGNKVVANLRERLWQKQLRLGVTAYDERGSGDYISRFNNDTAALRSLVAEGAAGFIAALITGAGSLVFLFSLNAGMTAVMLAAIPLAALILVPLGRAMHGIAKATMTENARFTGVLGRVLGDIRLVKASNAEPRELKRGQEAIRGLFKLGMRETKINALVSPLMGLVMMLLMVVIVGYGGVLVSSGALTAGSLVAYILYLIQIIMPIAQIAQFVTQFQKARGATDSLTEILEMPEEPEGGLPLSQARGVLSFESVAFGYRPDEPVIKGLSFEVEQGSVTALVGPSGSGKTTVFSLIERFYAPQSGTIALDGRPVSDYDLAEWRGRIGYVSQDSPMVQGSIAENMRYGLARPVGLDELREVALQANALDFIEALPGGFDTDVGERGVKLSGGQRQRLAIARALLRDPDILLLDEATASLDSATEAQVQLALGGLMRGRTTLVIAHRLSTVVDADRILFLEDGRLTGSGSHEELYSGHELYRRFADHQFRLAEAEVAVVS
jgi:ATP-binding cassette, subfamily B, bacterial AbcA/BmrA